MNAEIIAIGTELLLGEIQDTNTPQIARALRGIGLDLFRTATVGDKAQRIAQAVRESMGRAQAVITTGGLGPTVDDATREGIALAAGVETEFRPELWEQIQQRFARYGRTPTENNRRQAHIPAGALPMENQVGTAPGFIVEIEHSAVLALPGVPSEMSIMLEASVIPYLRGRLSLRGLIKTRVLHTAGVGESWLDERVQDLERLSNPTIGLSAHAGQVDVRITAKADHEAQADELLWGMQATVQQRLGEAVYGADEESLEHVAAQALTRHGWRLAVVESGTGGALASSLAPFDQAFAGGQVLPGSTEADLGMLLRPALEEHHAAVGMALALMSQPDHHTLRLHLITPAGEETVDRSYGGPPATAPAWAKNLALDLLRRRLA
jgi:competence/damage-inducible protein CinA-like protein